MIQYVAISIGLILAANGATVTLLANGTVASPGSFSASAGESVTLSIQYDDSTSSTELGGVGAIFNSPISINLVGIAAEWFGTNPAPVDHSITFNIEAVETALIFSVPTAGASFGANPHGLLPVSMILEINGLSPWFSGSSLADLASAGFTGAETATLTLFGGGGTTPLTATMSLSSIQVVPEPGTAILLMLGVASLCRRKRRNGIS
jgi:hypothetical protein